MFKRTSLVDNLFSLRGKSSSSSFVKQKLRVLEQINTPQAIKATKHIGDILRRPKKNQARLQAISEIIRSYFFDGFPHRFSAFKRAGIVLKAILLWPVTGGVLIYSTLVINVSESNGLSEQEYWPLVILSNVLLFIIPLCFSLFWAFAIYTWFGVWKWVAHFLRLNDGVMHKTQIILEEFMMSFKPGGRQTQVSFPESKNSII